MHKKVKDDSPGTALGVLKKVMWRMGFRDYGGLSCQILDATTRGPMFFFEKKCTESYRPGDQEKGIPRVPPECPQALICNMHNQYPIQSNRNQYHHNANS